MPTTFETKTFTAAELREQPELLHEISRVVNECFGENTLLHASRFEDDDQLCDELGDAGLAVIMFDTLGQLLPIATACIKVAEDHMVQSTDAREATIANRMVTPIFVFVLIVERVSRQKRRSHGL
jgi:hypothetical protein